MSIRRLTGTVAAAALPWSWFLIRDSSRVFEVVAIAMPVLGALAGLLAVGILAAGWRRRSLGGGLVALVLAISVGATAVAATALPRVPQDVPPPGEETIYLVAANLASDNPDADRVLRGLASGFPDVIVTAETNDDAILALADLEGEFPHVVIDDEGSHSRVVVYSRFPLTPVPRPAGVGFARVLPVEVEAGFGTFTLFAAHLPRPWFTGSGETSYQATLADQQAIVTEFAAAVAATAGPVVVAGDLNLSDRGRGYRMLLDEGGLTDVVRGRWAGSTSLRWWPLALRIDHVLARGGICGTDPARLTLPGSDHRGLWVELGPCSPAPAGG